MKTQQKQGRLAKIEDWSGDLQAKLNQTPPVNIIGIEVGERLAFTYRTEENGTTKIKTDVYGKIIQKQPHDKMEGTFIIKTTENTFLWQPRNN